jgi:FkbM family methyltransferase
LKTEIYTKGENMITHPALNISTHALGISLDNYTDVATLRRTFAFLCEAYQENPLYGMDALHLSKPLLSRPVVVPASGHGIAHQALSLLATHGNLVALVDDFQAGREIFGHTCRPTSELAPLRRQYPDLLLVDTSMTLTGRMFIERLASQEGIDYLDMLQFYRAVRHIDQVDLQTMGPCAPLAFFEQTLTHERDFTALERHFQDHFSLVTLYNLLIARLTFDPARIARVSVGYNHDQVHPNNYIFSSRHILLGEQEVFVDCGAYRGDTIARFNQAVSGRFKQIYAFEPDPVHFAYCKARALELFGLQRESQVICRPVGVWEKSGMLQFCSLDLASHFVPAMDFTSEYANSSATSVTGQVSGLEVVALDEAISEKITLLKLEVEGSEVPALNGARQTILRSHPKMALSVYHRPLDLIQILAFVEELGLGYTMSMLHHNTDYSGTVCYYTPRD